MAILILGLILFLGPHSLKMAAREWRRGVVERRGEGPLKGLVALSSIGGIVLIVWGFASADSVILYTPPPWGHTLCAILMAPALILAIASGESTGSVRTWTGLSAGMDFLLAVLLIAGLSISTIIISIFGPTPEPQLIPGVFPTRAAVSNGYGSQPFQGKGAIGLGNAQSTSQAGHA